MNVGDIIVLFERASDVRKATFNAASYASLHAACAKKYNIDPNSFVLKYQDGHHKITMVYLPLLDDVMIDFFSDS